MDAPSGWYGTTCQPFFLTPLRDVLEHGSPTYFCLQKKIGVLNLYTTNVWCADRCGQNVTSTILANTLIKGCFDTNLASLLFSKNISMRRCNNQFLSKFLTCSTVFFSFVIATWQFGHTIATSASFVSLGWSSSANGFL